MIFSRSVGLPHADPTQYDPYWSSTVLLLAFENNLTDDSLKNNASTVNGTLTYNSTTVKYGTYSGFLTSGTNYVNLSSTSSFYFGTGDFTVETWAYVVGTRWGSGNVCVMDTANQLNNTNGGPSFFGLSTSNANVTAFRTAIYNNGTWGFATGNQVLGVNSWHHLAWGRGNGRMYLSWNGTTELKAIGDTKNYFPYNVKIKQDAYNEYQYSIYLDEFRVTNGYWRYGAVNTNVGDRTTYTTPTTRFPRR